MHHSLIVLLALLLFSCNGEDPKVGTNNPVSNGTANNREADADNSMPDMGDSPTDMGTPPADMGAGPPDMASTSDSGGPDMVATDTGGSDMAVMCEDGELLCFGVCAACPAPDNVATFACNGMGCEVATCEVGYESCDTGCCVPPMPAASGRASSADFSALDTSIALDPDGYPRIVYRNFFNTNIEQSAWDGRQWVTSVIETGVDPYVTSMAVDDNGWTHASWWETDTLALRYARQTAAGWDVQTVASPIAGYSSLALDSQNRPHLVYQDETLKVLKHSRWDGATWVTTDVYANDPSSLYNYPQLAIDSMDRPRVAFVHSTDFAVRYAAWDGAAWQIADVASTSGLAQYVDLAIDGTNGPFIVYRASGNLRLARRMAGSWVVTDVDTSGDWGRTSTIQIDSAGLPHILTHGNSQDVGRIFSFDGSTWQTTDVLGGASITEGASMALDATDAMHISMGTKAPPVHLEYELIP